MQNSQEFRAGTNHAVCTRTPGIAHGMGRTELTEIPGTGMEVLQNTQKFRVLWHGRTELTEVPGTGTNILENSQKFRVRVIPG